MARGSRPQHPLCLLLADKRKKNMEEILTNQLMEIMQILNMRGDESTDTECLDMIVKLLANNGFDVEAELV